MEIENYLEEDEIIIWSGKPNMPQAFDRVYYGLIIFSSILGLVAGSILFLKFGIISWNQGYKLPALLPIIMGILPSIVLFFLRRHDIKKLKNTSYYLSNTSVIVINEIARKNKFRRKHIKSFILEDIKIKERKNGFGNIIFEKDVYQSHNSCSGHQLYKIRDGYYFMGIENVKYVYDLFLNCRR